MDETQKLADSFSEEEDEGIEERDSGKVREPLAKLRVFNNEHFPENEFPLFLGDNVLGRDPASCSLPLTASSVSKRHAVISLVRLRGDDRRDDGALEALLWDLGSMNGTRKGRLRLTPHVRYALSEGDSVVIADLPCQYVRVGEGGAGGKVAGPAQTGTGRRRIAWGCVSDSDPEEEISVRRGRGPWILAADSPRESSLLCSTLVTPTSRCVPESEEESFIIPSSSKRLVCSKRGQTPKLVLESDSEEEEEESPSTRSGADLHVDSMAKKENAEPSGAPQPVGPSRNATDPDSESDTDVEGEEPVGNAPGAAGDKPATVPDAGPSAGPVVQPEEFHLDSDTDVEDEAGATPAPDPPPGPPSVPAPGQNGKTPPAVQKPEFHLDSDTDTEDQAEVPSRTAPKESDGPPETGGVNPQELHYDSDTDAEEDGDAAAPVAQALAILSDSDTDVEEVRVPSGVPAAVALQSDALTAVPGAAAAAAARSESDSDTDVEEAGPVESHPPGRSVANPRDLRLDSGTDVEDEGRREGSSRHVREPSSSTPRGSALTEEELETQAFISTSDAFRRPSVPPPLKTQLLDDSQEDSTDEDLVFAPTQCFVAEGQKSTPAGSLALEATQPFPLDPFPSADLEDQPTQAFSFQLGLSHSTEATLAYDQPGSGEDSDLETTQSYGEASPARGLREREELEKEDGEEKERRERQKKERLENERFEKEKREREEEWERLEKERKEREEKERLEKERKEREEKERLEKERKEREEKERLEKEREEKLRLEKERKREERERLEKEREEKLRLEKERKREEWERLEKEREEKLRLEKERKREERERLEKEREEKLRLEKERKREEWERLENEREEKLRLEKERKREERERLEKEREEKLRLEKERKREERERLEKEREEKLRLEKERKREEKERLEKERKEREEEDRKEREKERLEKEKKEREEKERLERQKKERLENERLEKEKREREERERLEKEKKEREEVERLEMERKEREAKEKLEREKKEREEAERLQREKEREEKERVEKEKKEREEKEKLEKEEKEREKKERLQREKKGREEKERLAKEREEEERLEKEKKERDEKEQMEKERKQRPKNARKERGRENLGKESKLGCESLAVEEESESTEPMPGPGRRSRRSSVSSISSDRSTASTGIQSRGRGRRSQRNTDPVPLPNQQEEPTASKPSGRGRGRGRRNVKENIIGSSGTGRDLDSVEPESSQEDDPNLRTSRGISRGRKAMDSQPQDAKAAGTEGNTRTRGRSCKVSNSESDKSEMPQTTEVMERKLEETPAPGIRARGRGRKVNDVDSTLAETDKNEDKTINEETQSLKIATSKKTSRARGRPSKLNDSTAPEVESTKDNTQALSVEASVPKVHSRASGRGRKINDDDMATTEAAPTTKVVGTSAEVESSAGSVRDRGQKRGLEVEGEEISGSLKVPRGRSRRGGKSTREDEEEDQVVDEVEKTTEKNTEPDPPLSEVRPPSKRGKREQQKEAKAQEDKTDEVSVSAPSSEEQEVPQTPTGRNVRKRAASTESPSTVKTPRRSVVCAPSPEGRSRSVAQAYKVLFTGVTDPAGEAVVARLGGSIARGVSDMTHLVTDKVRRTVKFLCAVARGVPIVTTDWLEKSGKTGSFLPPSEFLVKDSEQEKKFSFCLEQSLQSAHTQPLLQGYEIHVTRSVKPDPGQMKDIISCSGARYLSKMPAVLKPQTVVVSCEEDAALCAAALSACIPIVSAEFLLTGILRQEADPVAHALSGPGLQLGAPGRAKGRKK